MPDRMIYTVELMPPAGDDKPHLALRRLLKYAGRALGWKCLGVVEKKPAAAQPDAAGAIVAQREGIPDGR